MPFPAAVGLASPVVSSGRGSVEVARTALPQRVARYHLGPSIAQSDLASLHLGVLTGAARFSRVVTIKRLHAPFSRDRLFAQRFRTEARLNARVVDDHVTQVLDVVEREGELWLVLDHVDGDTLLALEADAQAAARPLPPDVAVGIMVSVLRGLHAVHEATDEHGRPLGLVHCCVAPRNIAIARSGNVKICDFSGAKSTLQPGMPGAARSPGNARHLAPEQVRGGPLDRRADVFAAAAVLWEALTGRNLFGEVGEPDAEVLRKIVALPIPAPSSIRAELPTGLDEVLLRALRREVSYRFSSALEFSQALEAALSPASESKVGAYLTVYCEERLAQRRRLIRSIESRASPLERVDSQPPAQPGGTADEDEEEITRFVMASTPPAATVGERRLNLERLAFLRARPSARACGAAVLLFALALAGWKALGPVPPTRSAPTLTSFGALAQRLPTVARQTTAAAVEHATAPIVTPLDLKEPANASLSSESAGLSSEALAAPRVSSSARRRGGAAALRDCSEATYLGRDGIRHFKEYCL